MQTISNPRDPTRQSSDDTFRVGQRVHFSGQPSRVGTVKYVGPVDGYSGNWIGVDWDADNEGKHDGSHNGIRYFTARGLKTASFVRPRNLSSGVSVLEALEARYRTASTKEEEDEMYVLSARKKKVSIQVMGKDKLSKFEELTSGSLSSLGVAFPGSPDQVSSMLPNLKELNLSGNLLSNWEDVATICQGLPALTSLNLSYNAMSPDLTVVHQLSSIRILVLNYTGVIWKQVELLKHSLPHIEELHLMGNKLREIVSDSSTYVQGFNSLRLLNLENNCIASWEEIIKFSQLPSLRQLFLNKNGLGRLWYPDCGSSNQKAFENLQELLLGGNNIENLESVDSLNSFPDLMDVRLSDNPVADIGKGGIPRFVFIARLAKIKIFNGSEVSPRERKDSEIRYVRLVMSKLNGNPDENRRLHPRFSELKEFYGIEDERPTIGATSGPQKMSSGLISISLKCIGASMGEKPTLVKKLPATTTVGKLKNLCNSFFKFKSIEPILFLQEEGSLPTLLEDDMASLVELGVDNFSTILVDEQS